MLPAAVLAAAFAVRAWTLGDERSGDPLFRTAILDDAGYLRLADDVRTGASAGRPWFLAPLYPWVLAAAARGAPPTLALAGWLSAVLGAATAAIAAVAARSIHSSLAGWITGAICALSGVLVFSDVLPGQEPLLCLLHAATLLAAARYLARGGSPWTAALAGSLAGVAMLARATSGVLLAAFALAALLHVAPRRRALLGIAIAALGAAVVLVPAAVRNARATGDFTPFPWSGGPNLFMANGPSARRLVSFTSPELGMNPDVMESRAAEIARTAEGRELTPSEVSSYWARRTWAERGGAGEMASHLGRKALLFWTADEFGSSHEFLIERQWSAWLRLVPAGSWWILALGAAGWWIARRSAPALDFALLAVALTWAALVVFFPLSRYRLPVVPLAAAAAAAGAAELVLRGTTGRRAGAAAVIVAAAFGVSRLTLRQPLHARSWNNVAHAFAAEGDRASAMDMLRRSIAEEPGDGPVREHLGRLLLDEGRPAEALEELKAAQADERTRWTAGVPAVFALVALGQPGRAEQVGRVLLDRPMPEPMFRAELLANLALASQASGDRSAAIERLRAAEEIAPGAPAVVRARRAIVR